MKSRDLKKLPVWLNALCWLTVFFSPTICALLIAMLIPLPLPTAAEPFVVVMLVLSFVVPPMVYSTIVPPPDVTKPWNLIAWALTSLARAVQFGGWGFIILFPI